jgi:hypothetical protein
MRKFILYFLILNLFWAFTSISAQESDPLESSGPLNEDFTSFALGNPWPEGTTHGRWRSVFTGFGETAILKDITRVLNLAPRAARSVGETHSALVTSIPTFNDLDFTIRLKTVRQLRNPAPRPWEVAWLLWHFSDNEHFYYLALKPNGWELGKEDPAYEGSQRFLATGSSPVFPVGRWYSVRVKQSGPVVEILVDGKRLVKFTDGENPYSSGQIGLYTEDAEVRFDDIAVAKPWPMIWGVTVDDVSGLSRTVSSLARLAKRPTTRIVFDEWVPAAQYLPAAKQIHKVSDVMGEILDSSAMVQYSVANYGKRVREYMNTLGNHVDIWEIANEINGEWLGQTSDVVAKMTLAYNIVTQRGGKTALTLYYNKGCWSDPKHEMFTWAQKNIPPAMKQGLDYVWVSYYEDDCNGLQPNWPAVFNRLGALFPHSQIGFGECGTLFAKKKAAIIDRYYRMPISHPRYVGGFFWWYFRQDMVPHTRAPWRVLNSAISEGW